MKKFFESIAKVLNPLGLVIILAASYFQFQHVNLGSETQEVKYDILNSKVDYLVFTSEKELQCACDKQLKDSIQPNCKLHQPSGYSPSEDLKKVEKRVSCVERSISLYNSIYFWMYCIGTILVIIDAFYKIFKP